MISNLDEIRMCRAVAKECIATLEEKLGINEALPITSFFLGAIVAMDELLRKEKANQ